MIRPLWFHTTSTLWLPGWVPWCINVGRVALAGSSVLGGCLHASLCHGLDSFCAIFISILALRHLFDLWKHGASRKSQAGSSKSCASTSKPSKFRPIPAPKKGVQRMIHKRPAAKKNEAWAQTPYVQKKFTTVSPRADRVGA